MELSPPADMKLQPGITQVMIAKARYEPLDEIRIAVSS